jgi:hypothetical protein
MKRSATIISVVTASMLFPAMALLGADNNPAPFGSYGKGVQSNQKNECLLVAKNCASESSTVRQRLLDLRKEIAKGNKVYTPAELKILNEQLKWIEYDSNNTEIIWIYYEVALLDEIAPCDLLL